MMILSLGCFVFGGALHWRTFSAATGLQFDDVFFRVEDVVLLKAQRTFSRVVI
jgi:hypothetical protein